jgi:hypothetical protein
LVEEDVEPPLEEDVNSQDAIAAARGFLKTTSKKSLTDILLEDRRKEREREKAQI